MKSVFTSEGAAELISRINQLTPSSQRQWGKMTVSQMLAHCNVTYEMIYENKHPRPNALVRLLLRLFVKETVVGEKPYKKNTATAPAFRVEDNKNFEIEKNRLLNYIAKTRDLGEEYFDNKESHSFGRLTKAEWNNMFYKHLDHHLRQFGV